MYASGIRVERTAPGEDPRAWLDWMRGFEPGAARTLKIDEGTGVWRAGMNGRDVVVKMWEHRTLGARIKLLLRGSRAWRHWRGAAWLEASGFTTARTLALMTEYGPGGPRQWLVMEFLAGETVLEAIAGGGLGVRREHGLAAALGGQVSDMVARGRFNRDHKPSNLIVTGWAGDEPTVGIIDCVAIRPCRRFDFGAMRRMLASLFIEPLGVGAAPRRTLCMRALTAIQAKGWWRELEQMVREHGDPRPRVDPLAGGAGAGR